MQEAAILSNGWVKASLRFGDQRCVDLLSSIEGKRYFDHANRLCFEATPSNLKSFIRLFPQFSSLAESALAFQKDAVDALASVRPGAYKSATEPFAHQLEALQRMRDKLNFALFMEPGTGKTKIALDRAGELFCAGAISGLLVVALKGLHDQWCEHDAIHHLGINCHITRWKNKIVGDTFEPRADSLAIFATYIDALNFPNGMKAAEDFVRAHNGKVLMVVDESTTIKNPSASRSKAARLLGSKVRYRMIMSGTPKPKSPVDLFGQYMFLDESILGTRYRTVFERRYCAMGGFQNKSVIGFTAQGLRDFQERVAPYTFVKFKKDCLDLPEKQYLEHVFEMTPEQRMAFRSMKETLRTDFANGVFATAATAATALVRLQQISNGYITNVDGTITHMPGGRIDALMDLLSSLESEEKIVIWCRFREDIRIVMSKLQDAVEYHGGVSSEERAVARDRFLDASSGVRFFVGNPSVGGLGLNLQGRCRVAIYYSNSFDAEDRWQSEDRIHRIGMGDAAMYYDLIAKGGIDRKIISNLRNKRSISDLTLASIKGIIDDE
jgi:hypothetical protein